MICVHGSMQVLITRSEEVLSKLQQAGQPMKFELNAESKPQTAALTSCDP